ncbi:MAG TPA: Spy/CpxP family protein refolding chaperone [Lacunisphaera sp.]|nr:Spy/CpxP family protein refolding chaperone [Lacunisphaera sp.]
MKRLLLTLALGLIAGIGSHLAYYRFHEPAGTDTLEGQLAWMKTELKLTDRQFARIKELHQASHPKLRAMAAQVAQMQLEFGEFERSRRTTDQVDFLEFARFVEIRRNLNRACLDSTRQLVLASAEVMTPDQRQQYLALVANAEPLVGSLPN